MGQKFFDQSASQSQPTVPHPAYLNTTSSSRSTLSTSPNSISPPPVHCPIFGINARSETAVPQSWVKNSLTKVPVKANPQSHTQLTSTRPLRVVRPCPLHPIRYLLPLSIVPFSE